MKGMRHYRTKLGDNLAQVSQMEYGTPDYALVIWQHNRDVVKDYNHLPAAVNLIIPYIAGANC